MMGKVADMEVISTTAQILNKLYVEMIDIFLQPESICSLGLAIILSNDSQMPSIEFPYFIKFLIICYVTKAYISLCLHTTKNGRKQKCYGEYLNKSIINVQSFTDYSANNKQLSFKSISISRSPLLRLLDSVITIYK